jgi:beta-lactamase class A
MKIFKKIDGKISTIALFTLVGGLFLGFIMGYSIRKTIEVSTTYAIRDKVADYKFIKPLLAVGDSSALPTAGYQSLYNNLQDYIQKKSAVGDSTSVYFIDYAHGGRFAINAKDLYAPSSLMKVVVMIAYFKKAETDPGILDQKLLYQKNMEAALDSVQFSTPSTLEVGKSYPASDLIKAMIENSDNGAMNILIDNIGYPYLGRVYAVLGLTGPDANSTNYMISASDYSLFFRILYNGTYLNPDMSEKALSVLSKATFTKGISGPLPQDIVVAHKFGEHIYGASSLEEVQAIELHDCGIIYVPNNPYFLCVMTHGSSLDALESRIQRISSLVYQNIISNTIKN